jgi:hypothetical protein
MIGMKTILLGGALGFMASFAHAADFKCVFLLERDPTAACTLRTFENNICQFEFNSGFIAACVGYQGTVAGVAKEGVECGFYSKSPLGQFVPKDFINPYAFTPPNYALKNRDYLARSYTEVGKGQPGFIVTQFTSTVSGLHLTASCQR